MTQPIAARIPAAPRSGVNAALWSLQILTALAFLGAGGAKLAGTPEMVAVFQKLGLGQWFRYFTAILEVIAGIGLLIPRVTFYAAGLLAATMVAAVFAHLAILGGSPAPAAALLVFSGVIAYFRRPR